MLSSHVHVWAVRGGVRRHDEHLQGRRHQRALRRVRGQVLTYTTVLFPSFLSSSASSSLPIAGRVAWLLPFTTIYLGVYEVCKRRLLTYKKDQATKKGL